MQSEDMARTEANQMEGHLLDHPISAHHDVEEEHAEAEMHAHMPPLSIWPVVTAGGVALAGAGLVTNFPVAFGSGLLWPISVAGLLIMIYGIVGWIQELRHERHH